MLDEPTGGLDPNARALLKSELNALRSAGHTVFITSHAIEDVEQLCDHVAIVREGRIVADETLSELRHRAARSVTIFFSDCATADAAAPPGFLQHVVRDGDRWRAELRGTALPLIQWAAQQPILDLDAGRPDLETLFRSYYESTGARP